MKHKRLSIWSLICTAPSSSQSVRAPDVFRSVQVVGSTIGWENGADIDPDVLYYNLTPASLQTNETAR